METSVASSQVQVNQLEKDILAEKDRPTAMEEHAQEMQTWADLLQNQVVTLENTQANDKTMISALKKQLSDSKTQVDQLTKTL